MSEINGMTPADLAAMEYYDGHDYPDEDDQMFEGNIVLIEASALTDTSRSAIETMRTELDAEVVILPSPSANKKRMRRAGATIADVDEVNALAEVGELIEPDSKIAYIGGPGILNADPKIITIELPDDCESSVHYASTLGGDITDLATFFGVRHSQETTEKSEPTAQDFMVGLDDEQTGNKSGYGIDFENGRMGVMTDKGLELPLAVYKIRDVDYGASLKALGQFALRTTRQTSVVTEQGELIDTEVDLEFVREADAQSPARKVYTAKNVSMDILSDVKKLRQALKITHVPFSTTTEAGRALEQMVLATSNNHATSMKRMQLGWVDDRENGPMVLMPQGAMFYDKDADKGDDDIVAVSDITGDVEGTASKIQARASIKRGSLDKAANGLPAVLDTLSPAGEDLWATMIASQSLGLFGAKVQGGIAVVGPGGLGKSSGVGHTMMCGRTFDGESFETTQSTETVVSIQPRGISGLPVVTDDFRHAETPKEGSDQRAMLKSLIRIAHAGMSNARSRGHWSSNSGGVNTVVAGDARPLIVFTAENSLEEYDTSIRSASRSRYMEVKIDESPSNDRGSALKEYHRAGHLETIAYEVVSNGLRWVHESAEKFGVKPTVSLMYEESEYELERRLRKDILPGSTRTELFLASLHFGADIFIDALDGFPEAQAAARAVFDRVAKRMWHPQFDSMSEMISQGTSSPGNEIVETVLDLNGRKLNLLQLGAPLDDESLNFERREVGLPSIMTVGGVVEHEGELCLALNSSEVADTGILGHNVSAKSVASKLKSVRGYRGAARLKKFGGQKRYAILPVDKIGMSPDHELLEQYKPPKRKREREPKSDPEF